MSASIVAQFLQLYYTHVAVDVTASQALYGADSTALITFDDSREKLTGAEIIAALARRFEAGKTKVDVRSADFTQGAGDSIIVSVQGAFYTESSEAYFTQTFQLSPTKFRPQTWYIAVDVLRVLTQKRGPRDAPKVEVKAEPKVAPVAAAVAPAVVEVAAPAAPTGPAVERRQPRAAPRASPTEGDAPRPPRGPRVPPVARGPAPEAFVPAPDAIALISGLPVSTRAEQVREAGAKVGARGFKWVNKTTAELHFLSKADAENAAKAGKISVGGVDATISKP